MHVASNGGLTAEPNKKTMHIASKMNTNFKKNMHITINGDLSANQPKNVCTQHQKQNATNAHGNDWYGNKQKCA